MLNSTATQHVVSVSSGMGSAYLWHLVQSEHPNTIGLFADVNMEHPDNYRFLSEVHGEIGGDLVVLDNDGRTIWDVFKEKRFLANSRVDICSRELKRLPIKWWLEANCDPANTVMHIGIDSTEEHRWPRIKDGWASDGWTVQALLIDQDLDKSSAWRWLDSVGILAPELTRRGWPHANCGGGCVRAGQGQFAALLEQDPDEFARWETNEQEFRTFIESDVSILTDRRGGERKPMTLATLRERHENGEIRADTTDGFCNCMQPTLPTEAA